MHHIKIHYRTLKFNNFNKNVKDRENLRYIVICDYAIYIILTIKATRWEKYFVCTIFSSVCVVKLYVQINIEVFNPLIIYCTFCILLLFISSTFFTKTNHTYSMFFLVHIPRPLLTGKINARSELFPFSNAVEPFKAIQITTIN